MCTQCEQWAAQRAKPEWKPRRFPPIRRVKPIPGLQLKIQEK